MPGVPAAIGKRLFIIIVWQLVVFALGRAAWPFEPKSVLGMFGFLAWTNSSDSRIFSYIWSSTFNSQDLFLPRHCRNIHHSGNIRIISIWSSRQLLYFLIIRYSLPRLC